MLEKTSIAKILSDLLVKFGGWLCRVKSSPESMKQRVNSSIIQEMKCMKRGCLVEGIENDGSNEYLLICFSPTLLDTVDNCSATNSIFRISHRIVLHCEKPKCQQNLIEATK